MRLRGSPFCISPLAVASWRSQTCVVAPCIPWVLGLDLTQFPHRHSKCFKDPPAQTILVTEILKECTFVQFVIGWLTSRIFKSCNLAPLSPEATPGPRSPGKHRLPKDSQYSLRVCPACPQQPSLFLSPYLRPQLRWTHPAQQMSCWLPESKVG